MKVRINENETYELKIPDEEVSPQQLFGILSRLQNIGKLLNREAMFGGNHYKTRKSGSGRLGKVIWTKDRDEAVKLLKLHYTGTRAEKEAYAKLHNIEWKVLVNRTFSFRKKWDIKPREVGIKQFMSRGQFRSNE